MFAFAQSTDETTSYGDILQYDWPMHMRDSHNTNFNPGPAPDTPNVLWSTRRPDTGESISGAPPIAIDGKIIGYGGNQLWAFNAQTGALIWQTEMKGGFRGFGTGAVYQIDDTYIGYEATDGQVVYRISDGQFIAKNVIDAATDGIASLGGFPCMYWGGFYDSENKMKYSIGQKYGTNEPLCIAFDLSNPTAGASIAWTWVAPTGLEHLGSGGGLAYFGGYGEGEIYALNATTGDLVWRSFKVGNAGYAATYSDGKLYHSASSTRITCYNATNGDIIFDTDTGDRSFFAYGGAYAYGMYFDQSMLPGAGYIGAWDAETGAQRWKYPAHYTISYDTVIVADGKVYARASDQGAGSQVAGYPSPGASFVCLDAFSGTLIWELPGINPSTPIVAYGNLYFVQSGTLYCIGDNKDWSEWQNRPTTGVAVGQYAPSDINNPVWAFTAGGPICGSPVAVEGKVYFGAYNGKYYCINSKTGTEIWTFSTTYRIASTPTVTGGRLYTGADDGNVYCLNAATGEKIWSVAAGRAGGAHIDPAFQIRSSPQVVGQTLYVGGMDGYVYALNTENGQLRWRTQLTNSSFGIAGSPTVSNGVLYIAALDGWLSALRTSDGSQIWHIRSTDPVDRYRHVASTPIVVDDTVILGTTAGTFMGNMRIRGFSTADGSMLWEGSLTRATGSTPMMWTPSYRAASSVVVPNGTNLNPSGTPYILNGSTTRTLDMLYLSEGMHVSAYAIIKAGTNLGTTNAPFIANTTGVVRIWEQWVGHQIFASLVVADTLGQPKGYVGNDAYGFTCFNLTDGSVLSTFVTRAQVFSTAAIYDGTVYVGSQDGHLYAFRDEPMAYTEIRGWTNKGSEMFVNENLEISGQLFAVTTFTPLYPIQEPQVFYSPLQNATVYISFTKPDSTTEDFTATTDETGSFMVSYTPTAAGSSGWVVWYDGQEKPWITYAESYSEWTPVNVIAAPDSGTPTTMPTSEETQASTSTVTASADSIPMEYLYAIIVVVIIVIVAVGAYVYTKRKK